MKLIARVLLGLSAFALMSGCGPIQLPKQYAYKLEATTKKLSSKHIKKGILQVLRPEVVDSLNSTDMFYTTKPYERQTFVKHHWVSPPALMFETLLLNSLQNASLFTGVVPATYADDVAYQLKTRLISLHQSFLTKPSTVKMTVLAYLIDAKRHRLIRQARFHAVIKAPYESPIGGVIAANKATKQILKKIVAFVR